MNQPKGPFIPPAGQTFPPGSVRIFTSLQPPNDECRDISYIRDEETALRVLQVFDSIGTPFEIDLLTANEDQRSQWQRALATMEIRREMRNLKIGKMDTEVS